MMLLELLLDRYRYYGCMAIAFGKSSDPKPKIVGRRFVIFDL
jgi:hypothetical protein